MRRTLLVLSVAALISLGALRTIFIRVPVPEGTNVQVPTFLPPMPPGVERVEEVSAVGTWEEFVPNRAYLILNQSGHFAHVESPPAEESLEDDLSGKSIEELRERFGADARYGTYRTLQGKLLRIAEDGPLKGIVLFQSFQIEDDILTLVGRDAQTLQLHRID